MATLTGLRALKLPVVDLARSRAWWGEAFGCEPTIEFPDADGVIVGVGGAFRDFPGGTGMSLRMVPDSHTIPGLELMLGVADKAALEQWVARLDELGIGHSPVIDASLGWLLVLNDPDGHEIHLYTDERHEIDQSGRTGYGRTVAGPTPAG